MLKEALDRLESHSVNLLEECLDEVRVSGSAAIRGVPEEELRVHFYTILVRAMELLRSESGHLQVAPAKFQRIFLEGATAIVDAIDAESSYTVGHSMAVARHASSIASRLGLGDAIVNEIEYAARIHNIGLINSRWRGLAVPRLLTDEELQLARNHCVVGSEMLRPIEFLSNMVPMVRYHHTRYDGTGFTAEIRGESLPMGARIIAIADAYQAMLSPRAHRPAMTREQALLEIDKGGGGQFDTGLVPYVHELT